MTSVPIPRRHLSISGGLVLAGFLAAFLAATPVLAQPETVIDLADADATADRLVRVYGARGTGAYGVPVAGGHDVDGDRNPDMAVAFMTADVPTNDGSLFRAGEVDLVFGEGHFRNVQGGEGVVDTLDPNPRVLRFLGSARQENAGSEIWMDDVTGDGLGDLLICRQNFDPGGRIGAGALTVIPGSSWLRQRASNLQAVDLGSPPAAARTTTLVGAAAGDRLGIWVRTGDVDGDGIADVVVGADQESLDGETHHGGVWVVRGGAHLVDAGTVDLALSDQPGQPLDGHLAHVLPPAGSSEYHAGATSQIADLDGDGRGEVLFAAALNRGGAALEPYGGSSHATGGSHDGTLYVVWSGAFPPTPWAVGYTFRVDAAPAPVAVIDGEVRNVAFGEEIVGAGSFSDGDLDGDGEADLFVGDLVADGTVAQDRFRSGLGHLIFSAADLQGRTIDLESPPGDLRITRILGPDAGGIQADTAALADVDGDGITDLFTSSPHGHADAGGGTRTESGVAHLLYGRDGAWPALVDLAAPPAPATLRVAEILGAAEHDVLAYSAAPGDLDGDGRFDLVMNEMLGDGPSRTDHGNLIVLSGKALDPRFVFGDDFETGDVLRWSSNVSD